jgi:hypothetical protein
MKNQKLIKAFIAVIFSAVLIIVSLLIFQYLTSKETVSIKYADNAKGLTTSLYKLNSYDDDYNPEYSVTPENLVFETKSSTETKLKKDDYVVVFEGEGYTKKIQRISINKENKTIDVDASYTEDKLNQILDQEFETLKTTILDYLPLAKDSSQISRGKMYNKGDWYGTTITIKQTAEEQRNNYTDIYRVVINKRSGNWVVINKSPELIISSPNYPQVPRDILVDINKQLPSPVL